MWGLVLSILGCSGSQLQWHSVLGNRMLKEAASWVYGRISNLRLLGFLPWAQVPRGMYLGLVCTRCMLQLSCSWGGRGALGVTLHNLLAPHFRSSEVSPWVEGGRGLLCFCSLPVENLLAKQGCLLLLADSSLLEQPFTIILDFLKQQTLDTLRIATTKSLSTIAFSEEPDVSFNQVMENSFLF